ncbi:Major facilitator superfamily (MFS) profile domain-containing protein [Plasmodiophora brassicae]
MAGLSPYLHHMVPSPGDAHRHLAVAVSLFSVGRLVSSIPYGYLVDWTNSTRDTLILSTLVTIVGSILYMVGSLLGDRPHAVHCILASRFISGFGSGTLSATRAFVVKVSRPEERTGYVSWNTLMQFAGLSMSPILPTLLARLVQRPPYNWRYDEVYIPGMTIVTLNVVMLSLLAFCMRPVDPPRNVCDQGPNTPSGRRFLQVRSPRAWTNLDAAFALFSFLNFSLRGVVGVAETVAAEEYQRLSTADDAGASVELSAEFLLILGLMGTLTFLSLHVLSRSFSAQALLLFGMAAILVGSVLVLPPVMNDRIALLQLGMGFIWSIGSPITQVLTVSTYSQMMGRRPQGGAMGWLTTAGSLGRIVFPLLASCSLTLAHSIDIATVTVSAVLILVCSNAMTPAKSAGPPV